MLRGNMDSFTTPMKTLDFVLAPRAFEHPQRKSYISENSKEEEGAAKGSPLAQPLMDMPEPDPETQLLMRHPDKRAGLSLSTPLEEEGKRSSGESPADKVNRKDVAQLEDAFLEALVSIASNSKDEPGPPCFCSIPTQIVEEDSEDDGYEEFKRRLGMELTEPVSRCERKKVILLLYTLQFMLSLITVLGKDFRRL
ncbi:unnamed protein product [Caretta caretta]